MTTETFRTSLATGRPQLGTFILEFATPGIGALASRAGADWILYDLEHTGWTLDAVRASLAVSRREDVASFVRLAGAQKDLVTTALDAGAEGIMMPWVDSAEQAREIVSWMKYPPVGVRGSAFGLAHDLYAGGEPGAAQAAANASTVFLPQIETRAAVEAVAEIAAVDGVDVPFVGPLDLTTNLGVPGQWDAPEFLSALQTVADACRDAGKAAGIFSPGRRVAEVALQMGYTVIAANSDIGAYMTGLHQDLSALRGSAAE